MFKLDRFNTEELHKQFMGNNPINYIAIDNFIDETYLSDVLQEIKTIPKSVWDNIPYGIQKEADNPFFGGKLSIQDFKSVGEKTQRIFDDLQSTEMLKFLEEVTGIKELHNDPTLLGAGIHRISKGGKLGIHADFNIHPGIKKYRRLNVLLYLNKDWKPAYNGEFEFWNESMTERIKSIPPIFNRMVLFRINDTAFHGHPIPWEAPEGCERLSLALYYYTDERPEHEKAPFHWATWQKRYNIDY